MDRPDIVPREREMPAAALRKPVRKGPTDTAEGCRQLAESNRAEAALSLVPNLRRRLEHSAATWAARATLLDRLDAQRDARLRAADAA